MGLGVRSSLSGNGAAAVRRTALVSRAAAIAHGTRRRREDLHLPSELCARIDLSEGRARSLVRAGGGCEDARRAAALEFVASVVTIFALERRGQRAWVREFVSESAAALGMTEDAVFTAAFLRALASDDAAKLPPQLALDFFLGLLVELSPAEAVSLWTAPAPGRLECLAGAGEAATSRRLRAAARSLLDPTPSSVRDAPSSSRVRAVAVSRWDRPFAALVARGGAETSGKLSVYLTEAAAALSPLFERQMLFERNARRERELVSASERRLLRLGCDLHDGPLQEIVAFAEDLRHACVQVAGVIDGSDSERVRGRFDDLDARLASLDRSLRDIAHSVRSSSAVERPLEHALRKEVEAFDLAGPMRAELAVDGDTATLTASQKIALFRVVQESLANARKHSRATSVRVRLYAALGYVSVTISDDGRGFDVSHALRKGRLGLSGVVERVRLLGGDVDIESAPGRGAVVRATLPRWAPAEGPADPSIYAVTA
jgi:signal transduction histidine kinase